MKLMKNPRETPMKLKTLLLGAALFGGLALAAPAHADWNGQGHNDWHGGPPPGGGYHGGPGYDHGYNGHGWNGHQAYHDWHGHGWWGPDHYWHWYPGWGPGYGYYGPQPVYVAPPVYGYYAPPPPPPPAYYAPPPPPVVVAPIPSIVITPGGVGITP
jgi:hypothetical protein